MRIPRPCRSPSGDQPEAWLNTVEELVQHELASYASIRQGGREVPHEGGPTRATPFDRRIREPKHSRQFRRRARLVRGERSRPCVGKHHRPAQGDAPESPAVALADGGCLLEVGFSTLLIDLGCCGTGQAQGHGYRGEPPRRGCDVSAHSFFKSSGAVRLAG